ncbi:MAG: C10 family peptidase [Bacteroidota bacterium]|nr:C10 family peptidase [Bacteroidota bacterium]
MKKIGLLFTVLFIGIIFSASAKVVNISDAKKVGKNFYYQQINRVQKTEYNSLVISDYFTENVNNQPAYYIFNFSDKGFIIVSAEDAGTPVFGYSFEKAYDPDHVSPEFIGWMAFYKNQIQALREQNVDATNDITASWTQYLSDDVNAFTPQRSTTDVQPLLPCNFDQTWPYNQLCPADASCTGDYAGHVPVGCVATSMAQIMYYWRYPMTGTGYHCIFPIQQSYGQQCVDFSSTNYDWNGMVDQPSNENIPIATLSYDAGVSVDMQYGPNGSSAALTKMASALSNYFNYASGIVNAQKNNYSTSAWDNLLQGDLNQGMPVAYSGFPQSGAGHAWVCDGYQSGGFYHFNFGWSGYENGFYLLTNINPSPYIFTYNQQANFHIKPNTSSYPYYCTGQNSVTTYDYGTIDDGSGPTADYQNNANCSWLIAPDDSIRNITLSFEKFSTDPSDFVTVYDGATTSAPVLGTFSGTTLPSSVTSTGAQMLITFVTNGSTTSTGWMADYTTLPIDFCSTNTNLTAASGDISDGSGRFQYRNSKMCKWTIKPTDATSVTVTFSDFNTELNGDFVKILDLGSGATLGNFSGTDIPSPVTSSTGQIMIIFSANKINRGDGFSASYSITVGTEEKKAFDNLSVYPNPSNGIVHLNMNLPESQNLRIEVLSLKGETLLSKNPGIVQGAYTQSLDLSSLSKGIYILRLSSDKGISNNKIVIE